MFFNSNFPDTGNNTAAWDVGNVTNMENMFYTTQLNANLANWNVSKVTTMENMFFNSSNFNQPIGNEGAFLTGGQRQRIGLARAIYKMPRFIILDEPNANLDAIGDNALHETIANLKSSGRTVVVVSHRPQILNSVDKILVLVDGTIKLFGDKNEVLEVLSKSKLQKEATFSSSSNDLSVENKPALDSN
jgi:surface protein